MSMPIYPGWVELGDIGDTRLAYSYGPYSYGPYSYGLYSYGMYGYGLYSYGHI